MTDGVKQKRPLTANNLMHHIDSGVWFVFDARHFKGQQEIIFSIGLPKS